MAELRECFKTFLISVRVARCRAGYFATTLHKAIKGFGTDDKTLIRIAVSRCEKDMLTIKQEYQRQYANSLEGAFAVRI